MEPDCTSALTVFFRDLGVFDGEPRSMEPLRVFDVLGKGDASWPRRISVSVPSEAEGRRPLLGGTMEGLDEVSIKSADGEGEIDGEDEC